MVNAEAATWRDVLENIKDKFKLRAIPLFGPYDIVVEVEKAKDNEDLFENFITPINMIEGVTACTTYSSVGARIKQSPKEPFAFVVIDGAPRRLKAILDELDMMEEVQKADIVLGPFDLIAQVAASSTSDLKSALARITKIVGVARVLTLIRYDILA